MGYREAGPQGPSTETVTIAGSTPPTWARGTLVLQGSARADGSNNTPFMLFSILMGASGPTAESVSIAGIVQCHTEGTHEHHATWHIVASGRRTNAGASARTCSAGGGGSGQAANTFIAPRPAVAVSDPSSAVAR